MSSPFISTFTFLFSFLLPHVVYSRAFKKLSLCSLFHTNKILSHTHIDHRQRSGDRSSTQIGVLQVSFFFGMFWLVLFNSSDFIRLMRKIVFVFQIFRLGFVCLFWLWYVLVCNCWVREGRESEDQKGKEWERDNYFFIQPGIILRKNIV